MKRLFVQAILSALLAVSLFGIIGCASSQGSSPAADASDGGAASGEISVVSREDGSGTRGAFVELVGIQQKDATGEEIDMTTPSAAVTNSTSVMMTTVAGDKNAIGYISLGSLNDSVKAVEVDGVPATADNVKSGSYAVARPFNIVTSSDVDPTSQDFIDYILSAEGQAIVEENGYIAVNDSAGSYTPSNQSGRIVIAGSSSVTPVMEKLAEGYEAANPDVKVEVNQSDSTTGVNAIIDGTADIGMASRELKDSEVQAGAVGTAIAQDGIAVIVHPSSIVDGLSMEQIRDIYTGEITDWSQLS